ncbi:hypothetical protein WJX73_010352 [Symbiochloris irregularis]|uniref:Uncharacterized protein n=1 Tax=Symbiochloris irregularis TaxID=706552 RepID=A0AAW1NVX2_9CHLO
MVLPAPVFPPNDTPKRPRLNPPDQQSNDGRALPGAAGTANEVQTEKAADQASGEALEVPESAAEGVQRIQQQAGIVIEQIDELIAEGIAHFDQVKMTYLHQLTSMKEQVETDANQAVVKLVDLASSVEDQQSLLDTARRNVAMLSENAGPLVAVAAQGLPRLPRRH